LAIKRADIASLHNSRRHNPAIKAGFGGISTVQLNFGGKYYEKASNARRGPFMGREERMKAIGAIEAQLAKLKEEGERPSFNRENFQNMSEEERAEFREKMMKVLQERQKVFQTIMAQLAQLQGRRGPAPEGARYMIITTADLKPIQEAATKEKAEETSKLLARLGGRGRGFGGRRPGQGGQRPQGNRQGGQRQ
jgi:TolA-binding protein